MLDIYISIIIIDGMREKLRGPEARLAAGDVDGIEGVEVQLRPVVTVLIRRNAAQDLVAPGPDGGSRERSEVTRS